MKNGQSLIEVLVATSIGTLIVLGIVSVIAPALKSNKDVEKIQIGSALSRELAENIKIVAESDWHKIESLTAGTNYYLQSTSSPFAIATGTQTLVLSSTTFQRSFTVQGVNRDALGKITTSGGFSDPSTKKITISYNIGGTGTSSLVRYLTRYRNNAYIQTDWSGGSGQTNSTTTINSRFASSTNVNYSSTTGSIKISL